MLYRLILRNFTCPIYNIVNHNISSINTTFEATNKYFSTVTESTTAQGKGKWDLYAGVLVERLPTLTKTLKPIEKEFQEFLWQIEFEKSLKSDHELQLERDLIQAELIKKGEIEIDLDETATKQTAQDLEDAYVDEFKKFTFASRTTEDDKKNNLKSTNRKLEDILYLVLEEKFGDKTRLILPQGVRKDGETMRQAAERVLQEKCGSNLEVVFYGNAPCGFYKFKYPLNERDQSIGAKIFFYRASFRKGNVDEKVNKKFEWLVKDDFTKKLNANKLYSESVQKFLME